MKLGKVLTIILLLILLAGAAYGVYTIGLPYLEEYLASKEAPDPDETLPEETVESLEVDLVNSANLYSDIDDKGNQIFYFQFFEGEFDLTSVHLVAVYADNTTQSIILSEEMLSEEDLADIRAGGIIRPIVDFGGKQIIIYIKIVPKTEDVFYTVSFDTKGGSPIPPILSNAQGLIEYLPTSTTKAGYKFNGWYTSYDKPPVNAPITLTSNITLNARWRDLREYTVTFLGKDGEELKVQKNVEHGYSATAPTAPIIEGWQFDKWSAPFNNITADTTITAEYVQLERKIFFRSEVWGPGNEEIRIVKYGASLPAGDIPQVPAKEGYTAEWSRKVFNNVKENINVDAIYEIIKLTVTFKSNVWDPSNYVVVTVNYGASLSSARFPDLPPQKEDYDLAWEAVDLENITQNLEVNAIYTPHIYPITFRRPYQSGGGSEYLDKIDAEHDSHITPFDTGKDPEFFEIKWYTTATPGPQDQPIDFNTYVVKGPAIFYVKERDLRVYVITFAYNLGEEDIIFDIVNVEGEGTVLKPFRPSPPYVEGYTFSGWSVPEDYAVTEDTIVYAYYNVNYYMVRFYERGNLVEQSSKAYGTLISTPVGYDTEREGFIFEGWFTSPIFAVGTHVNFENTKVAGHISFYAKWVSLDKGSEGLQFAYIEISEQEAYYEIVGYQDYSDLEVKTPSMYEGLDVKSISGSAFEDCYDIISLELPATLEFIGEHAFDSLYLLTAFITKQDAEFYIAVDGILYSADGSVLVCFPTSKNAEGFVIPAQVKTIAQGAFASVGTLTSLEFESGSVIESIEYGAFLGCSGLVSIELPSTLKSLGAAAFKECNYLVAITGGTGLTSVGKLAFHNTGWLEAQPSAGFVTLASTVILYRGSGEVSLPNNVTTIADSAFAGTTITSITIGADSQLAYIGANAFSNCVLLSSIVILTDSMPEIGAGAFGGIKGDAKLYVPADLLTEYELNPAIINFVNAGTLLVY